MLQPSWTWDQPLHSGLGDSAWCSPPGLPSAGQRMLLSSVRGRSRGLRVCRSALLPAIIWDASPHSLPLWFYPAGCGRLSRCVTPTWADPARTSPSSGRWRAPAAGTNGSHRVPGKFRAQLAVVLLLQSSRRLSPTPHPKIKEQIENVAKV